MLALDRSLGPSHVPIVDKSLPKFHLELLLEPPIIVEGRVVVLAPNTLQNLFQASCPSSLTLFGNFKCYP